MKNSIRFLVTAVVLFSLIFASASAKYKNDNSWTFDAKKKIAINTVSGDCMITKSNDGKIHVSVDYDYKPEDSFRPNVKERSGSIVIDEEMYGSNRGNSMWKIEVPEQIQIKFSTASGDLSVQNLKSDIYANTASGSVEIIQCSGEIEANTASGNIELRDCSGLLDLNTASGNIELDNCTGEFRANTASGNVYANDVLLEEASTFSTASGRVDVGLGKSAEHDLTLSSASGRVTLDYNGNPIKGYFEFTAKVRGGRIVSPFDFDSERTYVRYGDTYVTKTARMGSDTPMIELSTATGKATLKEN